jgi:hypothetical protein
VIWTRTHVKIDFALLTETWLTDEDKIWIDGCDLNKDGYLIDAIHRQTRSGGGLAL